MTKSYDIDKRIFVKAFKYVKANKGDCGVDKQSVDMFEEDLENQLYKLWNRLSSGSYFPSPVRRVEIPKKDGGKRPLGIPTVGDRVVQTVVKMVLEPELDPIFHVDSFGYRPGKSMHDAVGKVRERCFKFEWVLDVDIQDFFESIDHDLLMKAVRKHTDCPWVILSIERWLKAPAQRADGSLEERVKGTPQGGVISPLLANLFLHYAFDLWMDREFSSIPFVRFADDIICHCVSEEQASNLKNNLQKRFQDVGLELHPKKTKIVYCKRSGRSRKYPNVSFDFLGFSFKPRRAKNSSGKIFTGFLPGISRNNIIRLRRVVKSWSLKTQIGLTLADLARYRNPKIRGWVNYYGKFYRSALIPLCRYLNFSLINWVRHKYKRCRFGYRAALRFLHRVVAGQPNLFAHWSFGVY